MKTWAESLIYSVWVAIINTQREQSSPRNTSFLKKQPRVRNPGQTLREMTADLALFRQSCIFALEEVGSSSRLVRSISHIGALTDLTCSTIDSLAASAPPWDSRPCTRGQNMADLIVPKCLVLRLPAGPFRPDRTRTITVLSGIHKNFQSNSPGRIQIN